MPYRLGDILHCIEEFAPLALQASYDNAGLYCGDLSTEVSSVLFSLDITEEVLVEAVEKECQLIVAHHPVIFKPIKRLTGNTYVEKIMLKAIQNNIALYASHTNLDNVRGGVNFKLAEKLGLKEISILQPLENGLRKLVVFVPLNHTDSLLQALAEAGAGDIGQYKNCSFRTEGLGTFLPTEEANPYIGQPMVQELVQENRIEVVFPSYLSTKVLKAMRDAHPYEEVAFYLQDLSNVNQDAGAGAIGELDDALKPEDFLQLLKTNLTLKVLKHTPWTKNIKRVAVCGGAGSFLLHQALAKKADAFVSSDFKYHEFFDSEGKLMVVDIGHYESEHHTKALLLQIVRAQFSDISLLISSTNTNPIQYYY